MWDERYSVDEYVYGTEPNGFLASTTARLTKGRVLCLAEGEGRNAVHLAREGFTVTAVDSSPVGLAKAQRLVQQHGVTIETVTADLADFVIAEDRWDSVVSVFCHLPPALRRRVHRGMVSGLKKGGTFLLEAYTPKQLELGTGGPRSADLMMDLATLREELSGLRIVHGKEFVRDVVEGIHHTGPAAVVQVLAENV